MIDSVLSLRPDRRRAFFEDIAGLAHCRARLTQARVELGRTNDNLSRVADLLAEIKPRLEPLSRRAGGSTALPGNRRSALRNAWPAICQPASQAIHQAPEQQGQIRPSSTPTLPNKSQSTDSWKRTFRSFSPLKMTAERELSDLRGDISRQRATLVEADRTAAILTRGDRQRRSSLTHWQEISTAPWSASPTSPRSRTAHRPTRFGKQRGRRIEPAAEIAGQKP